MVVVHNSQFLTVPLSDETILVYFYELIYLFLRLGTFLPILQSKLIFWCLRVLILCIKNYWDENSFSLCSVKLHAATNDALPFTTRSDSIIIVIFIPVVV